MPRQRKHMEKYIEVLESTNLFKGFSPDEIKGILGYYETRSAQYTKDEIVLWEGASVSDIGIVLSGRASSIKMDSSGKTIIISLLEAGSFIGVLLAASKERSSPVTIRAEGRLEVLFVPFSGILGKKNSPYYDRLLSNCIDSLAEKSMELCDRIDCLIRPTVRDKITSYLARLSRENDSKVFMSPLDRNAMSEYLSIDRSALSRELSKMKREGIIDYYKSSFRIL